MLSNNRRRRAFSAILLCALVVCLAGASHSAGAAWSRQEPAGAPAQVSPRPEFLVIIDAGHGGDDKGATLGGKLLEKDLALSLARELKTELEDRGVSVRMLRDSDATLSLQRRAEIANEARPNLYVALHAGGPGQGARVYAPALATSPTPAAGPFLPWESAQAASIEQSKTAARIVTAEVRETGMSVLEMTTPLRPLNNLSAPAIAVEWAPGAQMVKPQQMQKLETALASAVAAGIFQARPRIGAHP